MFAYLQGVIKFKDNNFVVIANQGIGYKVFVPNKLALKVKAGKEIELYIYHHVREDVNQLFGFQNIDELNLFEKLISVSSVGPKTALGIFGEADAIDIRSAIANQDASILKKVSGIGAKTAERIILELKNKIDGDFSAIKTRAELNSNMDAADALMALGYSSQQARDALNKISSEIKDIGERVKEALKILR